MYTRVIKLFAQSEKSICNTFTFFIKERFRHISVIDAVNYLIGIPKFIMVLHTLKFDICEVDEKMWIINYHTEKNYKIKIGNKIWKIIAANVIFIFNIHECKCEY